MISPAIRRIGFAALLLALPVFAQEGDKKEEKSAPRGKSAPSKSAPQRSQRQGTSPQTPASRGPGQNQPANNSTFGRGSNSSVPGNRPAAGQFNGGANNRGAFNRPVPQGSREMPARNGGSVVMRSNNRPAVVRASNGVEVRHSVAGRTTVMRETPDHGRVVAVRAGVGYVQRPYVYGGHPYLARTYISGGRSYESFYRGYPYRGLYLEVYAPVRYYPLGFYGWAVNPWGVPIAYNWGWRASPWFGFYGGFFTPYPVYASPALWLTDYMIADSLNAAYQAQYDAAYPPPPPPAPFGQVGLTPEVKQAIADEVQRQMALENQEARYNAQGMEPDPATSSIAGMLSDNRPHVFLVGEPLDLVNSVGQECGVTEGDVLQLAGPPAPNADSATLIVMASKGGLECRQGGSVNVGFNDLQDMQNHMRRTLDAGLADLQAHQGGLPAPPPGAIGAAPATFTNGAPPPDQTVATQVSQELQQGTQAEQQTLNDLGSAPPPPAPGAAAPPPAAGAPPATIALGQSIDQVVSILGQPTQVVDLGAKKIYVYPNLKITFNDGQVADVQ